ERAASCREMKADAERGKYREPEAILTLIALQNHRIEDELIEIRDELREVKDFKLPEILEKLEELGGWLSAMNQNLNSLFGLVLVGGFIVILLLIFLDYMFYQRFF